MTKKREVIEAMYQGVLKAHKTYEEWSGGQWIGDYGVEGFLTSQVAAKVYNRRERWSGKYVYLELPFSDIKDWSGARMKRGRPPRGLRMGRRVDVALCNEDNEPVYVIEVKRKWDNTQCERDLLKLRDLVARYGRAEGGSLESGFLAVYVQENNSEDDLKKLMKWTEDDAKSLKIPDVTLRFHKKSWEKKTGVEWDQEKAVWTEWADWEYGCHIIEVSRKR